MIRRIIIAICLASIVLLGSCELHYERENPAPKVGKVRILVYGNDYCNNPKVYVDSVFVGNANKLEGTVNDAVQIGLSITGLARKAGVDFEATYLIGSSDMSAVKSMILGYDSNAKVITDTSFTELKSALEVLKQTASSNDMTFIYYAGHGYGSKDSVGFGTNVSKSTYLVLSGRTQSSTELLSADEYMTLIDEIPGVKIALGDFCYSGSIVRQGNISIGEGDFEDISVGSLFWDYWDNVNESASTFALSAARYNEVSKESTFSIYNHGYFTNALLCAFGWDEDSLSIGEIPTLDSVNRLSLFNVANYVILNDGKSSQTPMVSGGSNDIVLFSF